MLKDQGCLVKVAQMPPGMDPDDFLRKRGVEAFREEILAEALPLPAFKLEYLKKDFNLQDEGERMKYLTRALDVISDLSLAIERDHYLRRLADEFRLSLDALKQEQQRIWRRKKEKKRIKGEVNTEYHESNTYRTPAQALRLRRGGKAAGGLDDARSKRGRAGS